MSKVRFFRETEANLPANNISHAGKVYFTNERNIYVYDASGARQKMTEVIFMATEAAITAIGSPLPNKVYVAIAEATMWFWRTSNSTWQKLGGTAVANLEDLLNVTITSPANGQVLTWNGTAWVNSTLAAGSGDVVGPASVTADRTAIFNGTTGKLIKQGAYTEDGLRSRANHTGTQDAATITGTKTNSFISDFAATVRATVLTGLSTATNAVVAAADTVLVAIGKLQAQFTALKANVLEKNNTTVFTPTADYHPATKKYIDDIAISAGSGDVNGPAGVTNERISVFDGTTGKLLKQGGYTEATIRDRANHTGTQVASTISDLNSAVAATPAVAANTAKVTNATHTGDVTGATALTIANDAVTNAKAANMAVNTIKGRISAGTGDPEDLSAANVRTIINVANGATANDTDANLKNRANHTGTQVASTISDFAATVRSTVLTGLGYASAGIITAADTVMGALGNLQTQISEAVALIIQLNDEKQGNIADFVVISGSSVTLSDTLHAGKHLRFTSTGAIEITINTGTPDGFQCVLHKEHDSNTISFGGTATYIATSPTITEEEATVSVLMKNGKVKLIGQYN